MGSPTEAELTAELSALRKQVQVLENRQRVLSALLQAHQVVASSLDPGQILNAIVRQAAAISGSSGVRLFLLDEASQVLRCRTGVGLPPQEIEGLEIPLAQSFSGEVAASGEPLAIADVRGDPRLWRPDLAATYGHVSYLGLPIRLASRVLGVLVFSTPAPRTYSEDEIRFLAAFADQAALALEHARLYEAAQHEVAHRAQAERALEESRARYRDLVETISDWIWEVDDRGVYTYVSPRVRDILGFEPEELLGRTAFDLMPPPEAERLERIFRDILASRQPILSLENTCRHKDGRLVVMETSGKPFFDDDGTLRGYRGVDRDVSGRKRVEGTLAERTLQLDAIRAVSEEVTRELDLPSLLRLITRRATELTGATGGDVFLWDEAGEMLLPQAAHGRAAGRPKLPRRPGEGVVGSVAQRQSGMILNEYRSSALAHPPTLACTAITAVLAEPLVYRDRVLGVIEVDQEGESRPFTEQDREILALFAAQAAIAIENARLHTAAVRRGAELEALLRATRSVMSGLDLQGILDRIVEETAEITGCSHVKVLLLDRDAGRLRVGAIQGTAMSKEDRLPVGIGHSGLVAMTGQPLFSADAPNDPRNAYADRDRELGIVTYLGLPIKVRDEVLGVLSFNTTVPRQYTPADLAYLTSFADQAATAIENARLYEATRSALVEKTGAEAALRERTRQLDAIRALSEEIIRELDLTALLNLIARRTRDLVECVAGTIHLWDDGTQTLIPKAWSGFGEWMGNVHLRLGEGVAGTVAERREGLIVSDFRASPYALPVFLERTTYAAVLAEPLLYRERLVGVISVARDTDMRPFTQEDREALSLFAAQAAIAIENARLHTAALHRGAELEALLRATRSVMSGLDLQDILDRIAAEAVRSTACSHVKLLLLDKEARVLRVGALLGTTLPPGFELPLDGSLSGLVAQTGQPIFRTEVSSDPANFLAEQDRNQGILTYLGLPIKGRDQILGVLTFNTKQPRQYAPEELAYLTSFADHAAIAIENARLFAELNQSYQSLQRAQEELIRSEKLRALGQMAAGIAHDLNNMLAAVLGQVELLRLRAADAEVQAGLAILETAATDGAHVVRRLQDFARQRTHSPLRPLDLRPVVAEALEITRPRWEDEAQRRGAVITVRTQLDECPRILGHGPEIREVLINLILNAMDAMPQGGVLTLAARQIRRSEGAATGGRGAGGEGGPRQYVELTVTDTGVGMTDSVRQRLFEPFFTTKGGQGTGLGLSVTYGIMERHGGRIDVASAPGRGTTVTLRFVVAPAEAVASSAPGRAPASPCRVLLIDDDHMVRHTLASILRAGGHSVQEAAGGAAGIELLAKVQPDVVVTDLGMPEVTGWDVARAVKARIPNLPIVLLTGWGEQAAVESGAEGLVERVLAKPIRMEDLLRVIADLTGSR